MSTSTKSAIGWDDAMRLHRLLGAAYEVVAREEAPETHQRVRWTLIDLNPRVLPPAGRALREALERWHDDLPSERARVSTIVAAMQPVVELYTVWFEQLAKPAMCDLIQETSR